jgi:hypothetical protein
MKGRNDASLPRRPRLQIISIVPGERQSRPIIELTRVTMRQDRPLQRARSHPGLERWPDLLAQSDNTLHANVTLCLLQQSLTDTDCIFVHIFHSPSGAILLLHIGLKTYPVLKTLADGKQKSAQGIHIEKKKTYPSSFMLTLNRSCCGAMSLVSCTCMSCWLPLAGSSCPSASVSNEMAS